MPTEKECVCCKEIAVLLKIMDGLFQFMLEIIYFSLTDSLKGNQGMFVII